MLFILLTVFLFFEGWAEICNKKTLSAFQLGDEVELKMQSYVIFSQCFLLAVGAAAFSSYLCNS